ncbi:phosphoribosylformylglycinamidine synthase I [candidate division WOR-3 bacterium]|uniref:Phosphoribosylformylglycinamidine synthase subunit PurQ n=1 Tax=candidate division WOR-3 bacterium TaxID=2052148 RepID=A0A660SHX6_UNCW3|nr:MAG: phosphoribosylformylglycinamidine synthase I [candidate division WOR-3 bacterium]
MRVKVLILRAAGTNCDLETGFAFEKCGAEVTFRHIWTMAPEELRNYQILVLPGGFTYGDYLGAGTILAHELRTRFQEEILSFIDKGGLILGVCNGFQVLVKTGLLPGLSGYFRVEATLVENESGRFEDRWVYLRPEKTNCIFLKGIDSVFELPVAHAEGRFLAPDAVIHKMREEGMVALRYTNSDGSPPGYPGNPNGSIDDIAGITDPTGQILGLMPHPERFIDPFHHPRHTREMIGFLAGYEILKRGVDYVRKNL